MTLMVSKICKSVVLDQGKWKTIRGPPIDLKLHIFLVDVFQSRLESLWLLSWTKGVKKLITTVLNISNPFKQSIQTSLTKTSKKIFGWFELYQQAYPSRSKPVFFLFYIRSISQCLSDSDTEITKCSFITWRELESWYVQEAYIQALHISCATRWTDDCSEEQSFDLRL